MAWCHWYSKEDVFVMILSGEVADGHHLKNKSSEDAKYLGIGSRIASDVVCFPYIDLVYLRDDQFFTGKLGNAY